jgi:hypothetical protein
MDKKVNLGLGFVSLILAVLFAVISYQLMEYMHPMPWSYFSIAAAGVTFSPSLAITGVVFLILGTDKRV